MEPDAEEQQIPEVTGPKETGHEGGLYHGQRNAWKAGCPGEGNDAHDDGWKPWSDVFWNGPAWPEAGWSSGAGSPARSGEETVQVKSPRWRQPCRSGDRTEQEHQSSSWYIQ